MSVLEAVLLTVMISLSTISFTIAYRQFKEKGFLLNNSYLYASQEERRRMNKKPRYRQSAIVFGIIGLIFAIIAIAVFTGWKCLFAAVIGLSIILIIYAIISSYTIERKRK